MVLTAWIQREADNTAYRQKAVVLPFAKKDRVLMEFMDQPGQD